VLTHPLWKKNKPSFPHLKEKIKIESLPPPGTCIFLPNPLAHPQNLKKASPNTLPSPLPNPKVEIVNFLDCSRL
jgi:hypothetical protein